MTIRLEQTTSAAQSRIPHRGSTVPAMFPTPTLVGLDDGMATLREYVEACLSALGPELTAYLGGADSVVQLEAWLTGGGADLQDRVLRRLAATLEVIRIFAVHNLTALVVPWLRELGPDREAPAYSIRVATDDDRIVKVILQAATSWAQEKATA